jgi:hypothetical protein
MGNAIDRRSQFDGGYLYVKTDRPYYYPGNVVLGKIYIRVERPMDAKWLEIKISGKEKASFMRDETYKQGDETRTRKVKERMSRCLLDVKAHCFTFGTQLMPGDYSVPFEFTLPATLPSSIMYHNKHHHKRPKAHITYFIKAVIENHDRTQLKYKQMLVLHEPPVAF